MIYLGDFMAGQTVYVPFSTFDSTGASVTMTGLALADIKVYKNGGVTQRNSTAGFTLLDTDGTDFDGVVGVHGISINLADNTDAGFYVTAADYWVVIDNIVVNTKTVSVCIAIFSVENRNQKTTAGSISSATFAAGAIDANAIATDAITAAKIAANAIGAAEIADGALDAATFATGALAPGVFATGAITALAIATDAINVNKVAAGTIIASTFDTGALNANALATDAANEIAAAVKGAVIETAGSYTLQQALSIILAILAGEVTISGTNITFRTPNDTATRAVVTVDVVNQRNNVVLTPSA